MPSPPLPPGETSDVVARSALVVAPHFDDEVLGCGGLVARLARRGAAVRVLFLSDGSGGVEAVDDRAAYAARRREEAAAAVAALGVAGFDALGLPDGALDAALDDLVRGLDRALRSFRPELLLVPSPLEATGDHRAAFAALHRLLGGLRDGGDGSRDDGLLAVARGLRVLAYEVNHPLYADLLVDVSDEVETLERAMACYPSQQARHDYLGARLGLSRWRALSLPPGPRAVEAYRRLSLDDFTTRGPAALVAHLGGASALLAVDEGPRLSVVVRTHDRPELLREALASLAASTYRRAEVVLVNDGGAPPEVPEGFPLPLLRVELPERRGRAAAANAGIAAASGDGVAFLDDDDLVEREHLAVLAGLLQAPGVRVAYTDAAVGVYRLGEGGWRLEERRLPYSRDFDPDTLLLDNYIPFNTVVVERRLLDEVGPLDESLDFFEDWDLLIRLAARAPFHHLARVTCEYRQFRGAGHHVLGDNPRQRADFLATKARVVERHRERLPAERLAAVVDRLRAEAVAALDDARSERRAGREAREATLRVQGELESVERRRQTLEELHRRDQAEQAALRGSVREREGEIDAFRRELGERDLATAAADRELHRLFEREKALLGRVGELEGEVGRVSAEARANYAEIDRLHGVIRAMEATRAWRLHLWWERHRP